jgi:pSer/pThr/pTyr-binding forkhead associated (FHA) protein
MNSFSGACGISGPLRLVVAGASDESEVRLLHQPFALVGRDQRADVPLDHKLVSRRHVYIQIVAGEAFWVDLDSRSGTLSEGQLHKLGWLDAGKSIGIGPFELRRRFTARSAAHEHRLPADARVSPLVARSMGDQQLPEVTLEFLNGPSRAARWPVNRVMSLVGSAEGCKFRLADPSVASFHCCLVKTPLGLWVVDLLGPNTIGVNDAVMRYAQLADHDVLRVGRYHVRIHIQPVGRSDKPIAATVTIPSIVPRSDPSREAILTPGFSNLASGTEPAGKIGKPQPTRTHTTSLEWLSLPADEPILLERTDLAKSVLVPLVNQFGLMQEQMLDQFQQTISILVHSFGALHRDQMNLIREELDHLRSLTREFHALKSELAAREPNFPARELAYPLPGAEGQLALTDTQQPEDWLVPDTECTVKSSTGAVGIGSDPSSTVSVSRNTEKEASLPSPAAPSQVQGATASPHAHSVQHGSKTESDQDIMVWLHDRMVTLQQERETRWQKILKLLPRVS